MDRRRTKDDLFSSDMFIDVGITTLDQGMYC